MAEGEITTGDIDILVAEESSQAWAQLQQVEESQQRGHGLQDSRTES